MWVIYRTVACFALPFSATCVLLSNFAGPFSDETRELGTKIFDKVFGAHYQLGVEALITCIDSFQSSFTGSICGAGCQVS